MTDRTNRGPRRSEGGGWIDTGDTPLLTPEEERALGERVSQGDPEARDHLIRANLRLVARLAERFRGRGVPYADLVAEGNLGLIRAVESFDPNKGHRLGTHARNWIKQCLCSALASHLRPIRLPRHAMKAVGKWRQKEAELADALKPQTRRGFSRSFPTVPTPRNTEGMMNHGPSTSEKAFYSVADLEARWGVSRWTVYRLANEGKIKKSRIGGTVRFSAATIQAFEKKAGA